MSSHDNTTSRHEHFQWRPYCTKGTSPKGGPQVIPERPFNWRGESNIKYTNFSLLHNRLGHRAISTILATDEHRFWHDTRVHIEPETDCNTCKIATICKTDGNKLPHTPAGHPGESMFMDILPCKSQPGLMPKTSHAYCLILVDAYAQFSAIYGLSNKSTKSVVDTILEYGATYRVADTYGYLDIEHIRADAGSEFTSTEFKQFCIKHQINLFLAAPNVKILIIWQKDHGRQYTAWPKAC